MYLGNDRVIKDKLFFLASYGIFYYGRPFNAQLPIPDHSKVGFPQEYVAELPREILRTI